MCKKEKLYKLVNCCEWFEGYLRLNEGVIRHPGFLVSVKEDKIFVECPSCQEEKSEAKFEDLIRDE